MSAVLKGMAVAMEAWKRVKARDRRGHDLNPTHNPNDSDIHFPLLRVQFQLPSPIYQGNPGRRQSLLAVCISLSFI
jgi:hypothetical protein